MRCYVLQEPLRSKPSFRADWGKDFVAIDEVALARGDLKPRAPLTLRHIEGASAPSDVVWTTLGMLPPVVVSSKVVTILRDAHLTGWSTFPIALQTRRRESLDGYEGLSVTGRCGPVRKMSRGIEVDELAWDGSDLFIPESGFFAICCTERCRDLLTAQKIENVAFVDARDIVLPE